MYTTEIKLVLIQTRLFQIKMIIIILKTTLGIDMDRYRYRYRLKERIELK